MARKLDAISILEDDHDRVRSLFSKMQKAADGGAPREDLVVQVLDELDVHTKLEEEIFYPAFRDAAASSEDAHLYYEAVEEHHIVHLISPEIEQESSGTMTYAAKVKVLRDVIEHHLEEEEGDLFPSARELLRQDELEELGERMLSRKQELLEEAARRIDLNAASADELTRIEGIGTAVAQHIVEYRDQHGRFSGWDDLYGVEGLGHAMVERLKSESRIGG